MRKIFEGDPSAARRSSERKTGGCETGKTVLKRENGNGMEMK